VRRVGKAARNVLTYLSMVTVALAAAEALAADVEINRLPLWTALRFDWDTVAPAFVKKRTTFDSSEQGCLGTSYGGWASDEMPARYFDWLDAPIGALLAGSLAIYLERYLSAPQGWREEIELRSSKKNASLPCELIRAMRRLHVPERTPNSTVLVFDRPGAPFRSRVTLTAGTAAMRLSLKNALEQLEICGARSIRIPKRAQRL